MANSIIELLDGIVVCLLIISLTVLTIYLMISKKMWLEKGPFFEMPPLPRVLCASLQFVYFVLSVCMIMAIMGSLVPTMLESILNNVFNVSSKNIYLFVAVVNIQYGLIIWLSRIPFIANDVKNEAHRLNILYACAFLGGVLFACTADYIFPSCGLALTIQTLAIMTSVFASFTFSGFLIGLDPHRMYTTGFVMSNLLLVLMVIILDIIYGDNQILYTFLIMAPCSCFIVIETHIMVLEFDGREMNTICEAIRLFYAIPRFFLRALCIGKATRRVGNRNNRNNRNI